MWQVSSFFGFENGFERQQILKLKVLNEKKSTLQNSISSVLSILMNENQILKHTNYDRDLSRFRTNALLLFNFLHSKVNIIEFTIYFTNLRSII